MGSEHPLHEAAGAASGNLLLINLSQQLPGANGEDREGLGSESWSYEVPSARQAKVVGAVRVVYVDTGSARKEQAVERVDSVETVREKCQESDPHVFDGDYQTIKNILDIKENPVYSAAFDEWNRKLKEIRVKLVEKESEKTDLTTQVYNIIGFFSVFQGVVLTAVSQLSAGSGDKCRKTWVPVLLSAIAAFVAYFALYKKFAALQLVEGLSVEPRAERDEYQKRVSDLLKHGKRFRFFENYPKKVPKETSKDPKSNQGCSGLHKSVDLQVFRHLAALRGSIALHNVVLVSVVLFSGVFVLSYFVILCDKLLI